MFAIVENRAPKEPGVYPTGPYRFLRPLPFVANPFELRSMAVNAIGDLVRPGDDATFRALWRLYEKIDEKVRENRDPMRPIDEEELLDSLLATLYWNRRAIPTGPGMPENAAKTLENAANERIEQLRSGPAADDAAAVFCLRLGRYGDAIEIYKTVVQGGRTRAYPYYNMACAYALASLDGGIGEAEPDATPLRSARRPRARGRVGYLDWPWMEQDRDLDAIRDAPRYAALLAKVKEEFRPPPSSVEARQVMRQASGGRSAGRSMGAAAGRASRSCEPTIAA